MSVWCDCGHAWSLHDIYEPGDPRELCCVEGCDQRGCPGRADDMAQVIHQRTDFPPQAGHRDAAHPQHPGQPTHKGGDQ